LSAIEPAKRPGGGPRGFTMIAMMVAIGLLGVFAVVATHLMQTTMKLYREAGSADAYARGVESATRLLRADAWAARRVTVAGEHSVTLERDDARSVVWQVDAEGNLLRTPAGVAETIDPPARWPEIGRRMSFASDGTCLLVRGMDRGADRAGGIRMTSQVMVSQGGGEK
jgi:type II secretory pathway pseudopilin PulG